MALEGRPPVPGRCTGLRTAPARIRDGTQGIAKPKGGSYCRLWVEFRGWAAAGFIFVLVVRTAAREIICSWRTEPVGLPALRQASNSAGASGGIFSVGMVGVDGILHDVVAR